MPVRRAREGRESGPCPTAPTANATGRPMRHPASRRRSAAAPAAKVRRTGSEKSPAHQPSPHRQLRLERLDQLVPREAPVPVDVDHAPPSLQVRPQVRHGQHRRDRQARERTVPAGRFREGFRREGPEGSEKVRRSGLPSARPRAGAPLRPATANLGESRRISANLGESGPSWQRRVPDGRSWQPTL